MTQSSGFEIVKLCSLGRVGPHYLTAGLHTAAAVTLATKIKIEIKEKKGKIMKKGRKPDEALQLGSQQARLSLSLSLSAVRPH